MILFQLMIINRQWMIIHGDGKEYMRIGLLMKCEIIIHSIKAINRI